MVSFAELRHAKPSSWVTAAADMKCVGQQSQRVADDIHANGVMPLTDSWPDHVGALAARTLRSVAGRAEASAILARSSVDPLDTLAHAVKIAQDELENAISFAEHHRLKVDGNGVISLPSDVSEADRPTLLAIMAQARALIDDAVEAATQADGICTSALTEANRQESQSIGDIAAAKTDDDVKSAADKAKHDAEHVQYQNSQRALDEIRDTIPDGLTPTEVAQWWNGLTQDEQHDLKCACPVELYDLDGIPESVKTELDRPENGYSAIDVIRYAKEHANDTSIDVYPNNCANFVSHALHEGGIPYKFSSPFELVRWDQDGWGATVGGEMNLPFVGGIDHTRSWGFAPSQRDFFVEHGAQMMGAGDVRPGDVAYWEYTQSGEIEGGPRTPGEIHHTAIVTGVLPDGEILYTQHTDSGMNRPLYGHLPQVAEESGRQRMEFMRPVRTW